MEEDEIVNGDLCPVAGLREGVDGAVAVIRNS